MRKLFTLLATLLCVISSGALADTNWYTQAGDTGDTKNSPNAGQLAHFEVQGVSGASSVVVDLRKCAVWSVTMFVSTPGAVINIVQVADKTVSADTDYHQVLSNNTGTNLDGVTAGLIGMYGVEGVAYILVDNITPNPGAGDMYAVALFCGAANSHKD